ncbi:autotransporter domain-containing protein [Herminiimonas arsenitoxidans]|uniref:autotransporter domain-containing protein n=1 Tax=Herminiimonas arsenitoxidans TaxID=1809410 RepID=UPI000970D124|nr:autotransporter domain-containing protein [Herminiimonas arsenitoxidans]
MNISYRSLWNPTLGIWVAVSEIARARGKRSGGSRTTTFVGRSAVALALLLGSTAALAGGDGGYGGGYSTQDDKTYGWTAGDSTTGLGGQGGNGNGGSGGGSGGSGGLGGSGGSDTIVMGGGGGGGGGGATGVLMAIDESTNASAITGGRGGAGGLGDGYADGGGGGGGAGVVAATGLTNFTNNSTIKGGTGGYGMNFVDINRGGGGGGGGAGVFAPAGLINFINNGTITGGLSGFDAVGGQGFYSSNGGNGEGGAAGGVFNGVGSQGGVGIIGRDMSITNAGTISGGFATSGNTQANAITFTGGSNSLTLQTHSVLNGAIGINSGATASIVAGNSGLAVGDVIMNGNATMNTNGNILSVTGVISGTGSLIKDGIGNLILTGTNTYGGTTSINAGILSVNGAITSTANVNNGGTLGGTGTVGNTTIASGGVLAPGNSIGTLNVAGNLNFASGSIYRVEVDAAGNNDRTNVTGTANLNGTLDIQASAGTYAANTTYTILHATGGLSGTFTSVTSNLAFLIPTLTYELVSDNVRLTLTRNSTSYSSVAVTPNQIATSTSLQSMSGATGDLANVMTAVTGLSAEQARASYDAMSGASLSAMSRAGAGFSAGVGSQMRARLAAVSGNSSSATAFESPVQLSGNDHVYDLFSSSSTASQSSSRTSSGLTGLGASADSSVNNYGRGFWLRGYGNYQSTSSDGNGVASTVRSNGLSVGFDTEVSEGLVVGVAGTFGKSSLRFDSNDTGRSRDRAIAAYASYKTGPWNFNGSANFAFNSSNMARQIAVGALTRTATSAFDGNTASVYGEATYDIQMQSWMLQPLAALSLSRSKTDGFTEQGAGALNLQVAGQTTNSVKTLFGAKAQFEVGQVKLEPRLAWGHEFGDANAPMTMQFAGSAAPSFLVSGVKLPRNSVIAGLGISSNISKNSNSNSNLSLFADVQGEYNSRQSNVALLVGIRSRW